MIAIGRSIVDLLRRAALPLGCYYTVTLLLPLANGAWQSGAMFVNHAVIVVAVPVIVIAVVWALREGARIVARALPLHGIAPARYAGHTKSHGAAAGSAPRAERKKKDSQKLHCESRR